MPFLPEGRVTDGFGPFVALEHALGFLPNIFRAQTLLPRVIETEADIAAAVLLKESALSRVQKECILITVSASRENAYCVTAHDHVLRALGVPGAQVDQILADYHRAELSAADTALLDFTLKLCQVPTWMGREDVDRLRGLGFSDQAILEAVLMTGLTEFLCTLSVGLGVEPDFEPKALPRRPATRPQAIAPGVGFPSGHVGEEPKRHLASVDMTPESFPPFAFFKQRFGFVPNIFRSQTLRPDVLEAEARTVATILLSDDVLSRVRKEYILLAVSAANLNTYCVAVHVEMLRNLGIPDDVSDQIAIDHQVTELSAADKALLDFALKLGRRPREFRRGDIEALREQAFTDEQVLEAVVMTALTMFLNTLQMGLGVVPDFEPKRIFPRQSLNPAGASARPMAREGRLSTASVDPDLPWVERVQAGEVSAFEELVRRHHTRIYRTLIGITGRPDDAEDDLQNVFLKAFKSIRQFRRASRFSTWLTRITINEGLERLRSREKLESLDFSDDDEAEVRPRQLRAWSDEAERAYSREQTRQLVEQAILLLPAKYRAAVVLRDLEQLSTEEAAAALGLGTATLKTRLLRGRLMLRDALAPHFVREEGGRA